MAANGPAQILEADRQPAQKIPGPQIRRLPAALPGGPQDRQCRPGISAAEPDHRGADRTRTPSAGTRRGSFWLSVLRFTNVDNDGVAGLELAYNDTLSGSNGVVLTAVNAWGYTLEQSYETELRPIEGSGLRLTIDSNIQHYLENALGYAVKEHHVAARGVGIVLDVNTGSCSGHGHHTSLRPQPAPCGVRRCRPAGCGRPERRAAFGCIAAGTADPMAQQSGKRPVRAGKCFQADHLCCRTGRRRHPEKLHLLLRRVHFRSGTPGSTAPTTNAMAARP